MTIERGVVVQVREDGVMVQIPSRGPNFVFGPMDRPDYDLKVNDRVLVGSVGYVADDFDVLTKVVDADPQDRYFIYTFNTTTDRDVVFDGNPAHMISPTFVWIENIKQLQVWTTTDDSWHQVSWDEVRVADIEADVAANTAAIAINSAAITTINGTLTSYGTRLTNLEAFDVGNTTAIQLNLTTVSGHKHLEAVFLANTVPLNDLSDVIISAPGLHQVVYHNGTNWVNAQLTTSDLSNVIETGLSDGWVFEWDSGTGKWTAVPPGPLGFVGTSYFTGGSSTAFTTTEFALPAWDSGKDQTFVFRNNRAYVAHCVVGNYNGAAAVGTVERILIKLRKAVNSTSAQVLGQHLGMNVGQSAVTQARPSFPIVNTSGADITGVHLGITGVRNTGANNHFLFGDSTFQLSVTLEDKGLLTNYGNLTDIAVHIT